ncbi:MAG: hypothetical protein AAGK97_06380, partial [Bacteroidota bacterium]
MKYRISIILLFFIGIINPSFADYKIWEGNQNSDWSNSANWVDGVPGANDDVIIDVKTHNPIIDNETITVRDIAIESGTLNLNSSNGLGHLICNSIYILNGTGLVNRGEITVNKATASMVPECCTWWEGIRIEGTLQNSRSFAGAIEPSQTGIITVTNSFERQTILVNASGYVFNQGDIDITNNVDDDEAYGIWISGTSNFVSTSTSSIKIYNTESTGIYLKDEGKLTNQGLLQVSNCELNSIEIDSLSEFVNGSDGEVYLGLSDGTNQVHGILNEGSIMNFGWMAIGKTSSHGILCREQSEFENKTNAEIIVGFGSYEIGGTGVVASSADLFLNNGKLSILNSGNYGLNMQSTDFENSYFGNLKIGVENEVNIPNIGLRLSNSNAINYGSITLNGISDHGITVGGGIFTNNDNVNINDVSEHGLRLSLGGECINNASIIINGTGESGIYIGDFAEMTNNDIIETNANGAHGLLMLIGSLFNESNGILKINDTGESGIG